MSFIQLSTNQKNFSYLIEKNPATGLQGRSIRSGYAFGWFSHNDQQYNIYFRDSDTEVSFGQSKTGFEYLDVSRYQSAMVVSSLIKEFFRTAQKEPKEEEQQAIFTFKVIRVKISRVVIIEKLLGHFPSFSVSLEEKGTETRVFEVIVQNSEPCSIHLFLHFCDLLFLIIALTNKEIEYIEDHMLAKYLTSLNVVDAPYYVRYLFKIFFFRKKEQYKKYKHLLEASDRQKISIMPGSNFDHRKGWILENLNMSKPIVDVGCGEGKYLTALSEEVESDLIGIDTDEEVLESARKRLAYKKADKVLLFPDLAQLPPLQEHQIILSEVIEHMDEEEGKKFLNRIKSTNPSKVIITTPNKDFNKFYFEDEEIMRHDDHKVEYTAEEIEELVKSVFTNYDVGRIGIGDSVDDIYPTTIIKVSI